MTMRMPVTILTMALLLGGCDTLSDPKAAMVGHCKTGVNQMLEQSGLSSDAADPLCTCIVDRMAEKGVDAVDMLGGNNEQMQQIALECAATLPGVPALAIPPSE